MSTKWNKFLEQTAGSGSTKTELSKIYRRENASSISKYKGKGGGIHEVFIEKITERTFPKWEAFSDRQMDLLSKTSEEINAQITTGFRFFEKSLWDKQYTKYVSYVKDKEANMIVLCMIVVIPFAESIVSCHQGIFKTVEYFNNKKFSNLSCDFHQDTFDLLSKEYKNLKYIINRPAISMARISLKCFPNVYLGEQNMNGSLKDYLSSVNYDDGDGDEDGDSDYPSIHTFKDKYEECHAILDEIFKGMEEKRRKSIITFDKDLDSYILDGIVLENDEYNPSYSYLHSNLFNYSHTPIMVIKMRD
jgi:hypothetical protein